MNSLFVKILAWLVVTAIITAAGALVVFVVSTPDPIRGNPWPGRLMQFYADEAKYAFDHGGKKELAAFLFRLESVTQMEGHLLDLGGHDLSGGVNRSEAMSRVQASPLWIVRDGGRLLAGRSTSDNQAFLLLHPPARLSAFPMLPRQHLWILGSLIALAWWLARYLTNPLRRVEAAAERLGQGDLTARAPVERSDEVGRLAAAFNRMAERIQTSVEAQQRLLMDVSHEIRSPLTRLGVAVELARSSDNVQRELDVIEQQAGRLNALIGSLLQISRAELQPGTARKEPVALKALAEDVAASCELDAQAAGCRIEIHENAAGTVAGDPELLHRAFENIVRNAIRYSPSGEPVEMHLSGGLIRIRDHGPGAPPDTLPKLFDAFYRVEGQGAQGTGLGLSIARRAVVLHGGSITARNASPGLEVVVELPTVP